MSDDTRITNAVASDRGDGFVVSGDLKVTNTHKRVFVGPATIYVSPDGHASVADDDVWVSALFSSEAAALSWLGDLSGAERAFAAINAPTGKGENMLGIRPDP